MPDLVQDPTGNDLAYRIIGAAMAVHNALGLGYKDEVYEYILNDLWKDMEEHSTK